MSIDSASGSPAKIHRDSFVSLPAGSVMEGVLFKERDHFKGWRKRYFKLTNHFLHYFLNKDDVAPRDILQISRNMQVTGGNEKVTARGIEYYIFQISHPKTTTSYRLSTTSKDQCLAWMDALRTAVSNLEEPRYLAPVTDSQRLLKKDQPIPEVVNKDKEPQNVLPETDGEMYASISSATSPVDPTGTIFGIPVELTGKVEVAAQTLLQVLNDNIRLLYLDA